MKSYLSTDNVDVRFIGYNLKVFVNSTPVIVDLETAFYAWCVCMFLICLLTKFHIPRSSDSLVIVIRWKLKNSFTLVPCCYIVVNKNLYLLKLLNSLYATWIIVILINCFSYRFLLVDFGLAQCVSADSPVTETPSETLQSHKRKREEVNTEAEVSFNGIGCHNFSDQILWPVMNVKH